MKIEELIEDARPTNDDDWGSDRQVDAETELWDKLLEIYGIDFHYYIENKSMMCKMTTDECLDFITEQIKSGDWNEQ